MRFLVLADIHGREKPLRAIIRAEPAWDGAVIVGDLTQWGGRREAESIVSALSASGRVVMALPGNMDRPEVLDWLEARGWSIHGAGRLAAGAGFFGVGGANPTPFGTPFELSEEAIARLLRQGYESVREAALKVMVTHAPPAQTALDRLRLGGHVGSAAVRAFLKEHPVAVCLCGHIHEAAGEDTVEGVRACNIGPAEKGCYALLDIENGTIQLTRRKLKSWT